AVSLQSALRFVRIAHAIDIEGKLSIAGGSVDEIDKLLAALVVTPIANPDEAFARGLFKRRMEPANVGGFVPDEHPVAPAPLLVHARERCAEREHAIVSVEIVSAHVARR